jgi:hypothetical protein
VTPSILASTTQEDVSFQCHAPEEFEKHWTTPNSRTRINKFWSLYVNGINITPEALFWGTDKVRTQKVNLIQKSFTMVHIILLEVPAKP